MGNKIITEKDFWMCTGGNVPATLQSIQLKTKKKDGKKYITKVDTATSSFIDFGCNKLMLIMAILAAVIAVLIATTGGAALIAIGALAGAAGAAFGAVLGGLLCGQKAKLARKWLHSKKDMIVAGKPAISGDHKMKCMIFGDEIIFAPHIKNWWQAIALAGANYVGGIMEGMMAGAAVGMGGAFVSGARTAFLQGGTRAVGQAGLQFLKTMPKNFGVNIVESFSKFGLGMRGVMGAQNTAATYGNTGTASIGDFAKGIVAMETGAYDSFNNIKEGKGTWQDFAGMAIMVAPAGKGKRDLEDSLKNEPEAAGSKADDAEGKKADEETTKKAINQEGDAPKEKGEFEAFEAEPIIDEISQSQQEQILGVEDGSILLEGYDGHKKGNHKRKGNYGEMKMDTHFENLIEINGEKAELKPLHDRIKDIDETGHKGIDGIYENTYPPPKYIIAESKYGSSELNPKTKDGSQMSDDWIKGSNRVENAVGADKAREIKKALDRGEVQKVLTKIDSEGNVTKYKIDTNGTITGTWF